MTTVGGAVLYRLDGKPVRLTQTTTGISPDGWMAKEATYTRYDVRDDGPGFVKVRLSREAWCSDKDVPAAQRCSSAPSAWTSTTSRPSPA